MRPSVAFLLCLPALGLVGFEGGCGAPEERIDLPRPPAPPDPPKLACDLLDETTCFTRSDCQPNYDTPEGGACFCEPCNGPGCKTCDCDAPSRVFSGCSPIDPKACEGHDEASCLGDPSCEPIYGGSQCAAAPEYPGDIAPSVDAGTACKRAPEYLGCQPRQTECGPVCEIYCPFGNVLDDAGCPVCACNPAPCEGLSEAECAATPGCHLESANAGDRIAPPPACVCPDCRPGEACPPCACDAGAPAPSDTICVPDAARCESLDEYQCGSTRGCVPTYEHVSCIQAPVPCDPNDPSCGGAADAGAPCGYTRFAGCESEEPPPPPSKCSYLGEAECAAHPSCVPSYDVPVCPAVCFDTDGDGQCDPCPATPIFRECLPAEVPTECKGRDERSCVTDPACQAVYESSACLAVPCYDADGDGQCDNGTEPCQPTTRYVDCVPAKPIDPCASLDEATCQLDHDLCSPIYGESSCLVVCQDLDNDGVCDPCAPTKVYLGCVYTGGCEGLDEQACGANPSCYAEYGYSGCEKACDPATGECHPCDPIAYFQGCRPIEPPPPPTCTSDAECPSGFCGPGNATDLAYYPPCDSDDANCRRPAPVMYCQYPKCGDGSPLQCRMLQPTCDPGFTAAIVNGCWECQDARTCGAPPPPPSCTSDAECPNGFCAYSAGAAPGAEADPCPPEICGNRPAPPPPGICVTPSCDDGSPLMCRRAIPICAPGETAAVINGCYLCVDARSCQPAPVETPCKTDAECTNGYCSTELVCDENGCWQGGGICVASTCAGDGIGAVCDMVPPVCPGGQTVVERNGCYACVDARTCE